MSGLIGKLANIYFNWRSFTTNRKILVIESDDWGSLRTGSQDQRIALNAISPNIANDRYIQLDGLAENDDLTALYETLSTVKDAQGNPSILTANVCTANPDFDKIKASGYTHFFYEPFHVTIQGQKNGAEVWSLWKEGIEIGIFQPQLHGREHVHALAWLNELQLGNKELLAAFQLNTWGIPYKALGKQRRKNLQAALDRYGIKGENEFQRKWLSDSVKLFEVAFGFKSTSFIAPAYIWHSDMHSWFADHGIKTLQGIKLQYIPKERAYNKKLRPIGSKSSGLSFFPRNVFFEPSIQPNKDWYSKTLCGIERAFMHKQPAIIGSHRINYIGAIEENNRTQNLEMLKTILKKVVQKWPDVRFISSDQLIGELKI